MNNLCRVFAIIAALTTVGCVTRPEPITPELADEIAGIIANIELCKDADEISIPEVRTWSSYYGVERLKRSYTFDAIELNRLIIKQKEKRMAFGIGSNKEATKQFCDSARRIYNGYLPPAQVKPYTKEEYEIELRNKANRNTGRTYSEPSETKSSLVSCKKFAKLNGEVRTFQRVCPIGWYEVN
ncbi:hypothetical protein JJL53_24320 (plasmid) [Aeromonas media]|uniref:hypothetical protein n=1 Tax=Aeromonas media TaxID=651 RepID=UPI001914945B|nr:hypothetical protein [Aeromonas media]QQQ15890.1 hypothetical protein JJL53_24320 [Aeromonas media]